MAKRHARVKLSPTQMWENEVSKWTAKRDAAIAQLVKAVPTLAKAERSLERAKRKAKLAKKPKTFDTTPPGQNPPTFKEVHDAVVNRPQADEPKPVRAIPYSEAHPYSKVAKEKRRKAKTESHQEFADKMVAKAEAALDPVKLDADIKVELQKANNRLASAFNASMKGKGPFKAVGGEPSAGDVAAEKKKRMEAMGFRKVTR